MHNVFAFSKLYDSPAHVFCGDKIKIDVNDVRIAECPSTFTNISSVRGCYKVLNRNLEWSMAGLECRSLHRDAHLLVIKDAEEQAAVAEWLASASVSTWIYFVLLSSKEYI